MEIIIDYLVNELKQNQIVSKRNATKLCKYEDIKEEFQQFIKTKEYPENGLIIEGFSAKDIHEKASFMNGAGVYNFMVSLRDNPEFALKTIEEGFAIK